MNRHVNNSIFGIMDDNKQRKLGRGIADRRKRLRDNLWPDLDEDALWLRKNRVGFTTIPRTITLIGRILDQMSGKGSPVSGTYLTLWCWVFDEGFVEIRTPRELAYESGFAGPRAEATWRTRMRKLEELGIISVKAGLAGDFHYVLMYDPIKEIQRLYESRSQDLAFQSLMHRLIQIGADDELATQHTDRLPAIQGEVDTSTLRSIGQKRKMSAAAIDRALQAIRAQGAREYISASGAMLELLSDLARAQALRDLNGAYEMFVAAHPSNVRHVSAQAPAKVLNQYILPQLDLRGTERFLAWEKRNPTWAEQVRAALDDFSLEAWAREAVAEIGKTEPVTA
jgi:hypothetical protein